MEDDYNVEAHSRALEHAQTEYDDLVQTWRDLERKAQGSTAIAGIFLAAVSILFRSLESGSDLFGYSFVAAFLLLSSSAIVAILVLLVADMESIEELERVRNAAQDSVLTGTSDDARDSYKKFLENRIRAWERVNLSVYSENQKKATRLRNAQRLLIVGVIAVVLSMFHSGIV